MTNLNSKIIYCKDLGCFIESLESLEKQVHKTSMSNIGWAARCGRNPSTKFV